MYQSSVRIHFDECDPAGILFYGQAIHLSHRQIEVFLESLGIIWSDWFDHPEWAVPIRHVDADYLKPLRAGHTYSCEIFVEKLGRSSVQLHSRFKDQKGQECTRIVSTHIFLDKTTGKSREIPASIRSRLEAELL